MPLCEVEALSAPVLKEQAEQGLEVAKEAKLPEADVDEQQEKKLVVVYPEEVKPVVVYPEAKPGEARPGEAQLVVVYQWEAKHAAVYPGEAK
jgi:hypothetical protein